MARHNREGRGTDQQGSDYVISYQPDWLRQVKVTRTLDNGRQSTKMLFRNAEDAARSPGRRIRTRITSKDEGLDFEIDLEDPAGVVTRITIETMAHRERGDTSKIQFSLADGHATRQRRRRPGSARG